jgi:hypothetical protein
VGINLQGYVSGLPQAGLEGKLVHFVMLFNGLRWYPDYQQFRRQLEWAQIGDNSSRWAGHGAVFTKSETRSDATDPVPVELNGLSEPTLAPPLINMLKDLSVLKFQRLPSKPKPLPPPPPPSPPASTQKLPVSASASKTALVFHPPSKAEQWFGVSAHHLQPAQAKLHDYWDAMVWPIPKQRAMTSADWRLIGSEAEMKQYLQTGEAFLVLHLYVMFGHKNAADNEPLLSVVNKIEGLKQHIEGLYQHQHQSNQQLTPEKYADYIEAMAQKLMMDSKSRKCIVHFLQTVSA